MLLEREKEYSTQDTYYIVKKKKNKKKKKKPLFLRILKWIFVVILIFIILFLIAGGFAAYKIYEVVKDVSISKEDLVIKHENTVIKDIKGNQIGVLNGDENRVCITLDDMPQYLIDAFVSIEDERFYEHMGVDIKRTLAATYTYIKNKGNSPFGGSSITQQLVKNLTNEKEDTWKRKAREMVKAYYVEQELSKEEILELYLNLIFLGDTVYGVEQGSNYYFDKSAKDLSLAESAFLAGINHSPNSYNPFRGDNEDLIKGRTKTVLAKMYELGKIKSGVEYQKAINEVESGLNFQKGAKVEVLFSYHTDAAIIQIIKQLQKKNDWTYEQARLYLSGGGFIIYTTHNPDMQAKIDEEFADPKYRTKDLDDNGVWQDSEASMVLIDHTTRICISNCKWI